MAAMPLTGSTMQQMSIGGSMTSARGVNSGSGEDLEQEYRVSTGMRMSGSERDVLYDMGSIDNLDGNVTGFTPTLSTMGSAILSSAGASSGGDIGAYDSLPPLIPQHK